MQPLVARSPYRIQLDVLYALLLREFAARFGRSRVGFLWTFIEPIVHTAAPIVIFGFLLERHVSGIDYPVFLVFGLLPYFLFRTICTQTMESLNVSRGLLSYRPVHLIDVIFAKAIFTAALETLLFLVIGAGLAVMGFNVVPTHPIEWLLILIGVCLFALGLGMILAAIVGFMPDAKTLIRLLFMPLYFLSGIILPITRFPDEWVDYLSWNPVLHWVEASRAFAVPHYEPMRQMSLRMVFFSGAITLLIGLSLYRLRRLNRVTT